MTFCFARIRSLTLLSPLHPFRAASHGCSLKQASPPLLVLRGLCQFPPPFPAAWISAPFFAPGIGVARTRSSAFTAGTWAPPRGLHLGTFSDYKAALLRTWVRIPERENKRLFLTFCFTWYVRCFRAFGERNPMSVWDGRGRNYNSLRNLKFHSSSIPHGHWVPYPKTKGSSH